MTKSRGRQGRRQDLSRRLLLTSEELNRLHELERASATTVGWRLPLHDAVRSWENFVWQVEGGYGDEDEYDNDLHVRSYLEDIMIAMPSIRDRLMALVQPMDERFLAATRSTGFPRVGLLNEKGHVCPRGEVPWWAFRLPRLWPTRPEENGHSVWDERGRPNTWIRQVMEGPSTE